MCRRVCVFFTFKENREVILPGDKAVFQVNSLSLEKTDKAGWNANTYHHKNNTNGTGKSVGGRKIGGSARAAMLCRQRLGTSFLWNRVQRGTFLKVRYRDGRGRGKDSKKQHAEALASTCC